MRDQRETDNTMAFINVGVLDDDHAKTKTAFRTAVKANPGQVDVYSTSPLGDRYEGPVDEMPEGHTLQVCGPDPATNRKWHATVTRKGDILTVK